MHIKNQQYALISTVCILLWYLHLHVSAGNPAIFRVKVAGLPAETCRWKCHNKNTPVELSAFF